MFIKKYSDAENHCLMKELNKEEGIISREMFPVLEELWPSLFGVARTQRGLFVQMVRQAQKHKLFATIKSSPKRIRSERKENKKQETPTTILPVKCPPKRKSIKFREQILAILQSEHKTADLRVSRRITKLILDLSLENAKLLAENKELRSFKRDSEVTRNNHNSPLMERWKE
jgi:hypothetical protein